MGKKDTSKYNTIKIGDSFAKWTVVGNPYMDVYTKVPCRCECGAEYNVDAYTLVKGKSKGCKVCSLPRIGSINPSWRGYQEIPSSWFSRFKRYSKIIFDIQIEDIWDLFIQQDRKCALTGIPISFSNDLIRGKKYKGVSCTASIDRIDSKQGYIIGNVQLVHKDINIMKNQFNQDYFIEICKAVAANNI